ncbi:type I polyketide synthase [Shewanella algae]|uniref:Beta-ketoacyl-acyl-carrier-protein synthase I n=1 Tax=Shewanella algae TaxID=38313 RepID=A0A380BEH6_9GAMM|nr:type I polyketide synthase [Shewanella algae]MBO2608616.1 SDR family NAD(P)-dependent oxidoreductase [Shewanella algae]SUJ00060.1 Beta-ketoacyl-acyl-carrier-protein synthase I [Shewanella algae]
MSQEQASQIDKRLNKRLKDTPIAIVGMASLFAGSRYLNQFWDLICDKIDAITQVPADRWQVADYFDPDKKAADKSYCKRGGFIPEVDFNPMEFGLPPNILELTDTSQLLSLVVAKEVLEDAGIHEDSDYDRDRIGITLGIGGGQKISQSLNARLQYPVLKKVFRESGVSEQDSEMLIRKFQDQYIHWEENSFPGSLGNVIAGRIANRFDLGGMNCVVDAACAGSLAAMRMALTELTEGRSDMMLTGGVCTDNSAYMYMSFSKTPAFTSDEQIKPFDADSRGMMIGEGIGMVALKRLDDAERDGDRIYAVIKGVGASSDGKFKSIYAPRPEGQAKALQRAYDDAGFPPHTLGLMEAHGTGTAAGDVAEFSGLNAVMSQDNPELQHIALGSIKSQVGHTKSTAGTAGVIKAALALHHKVLPPTINVKQPNPKMAVEQSPFYLNTQTRPWMPRTDGTPRRAAVSSFGFGGTNFHLVLEEHSPELPKQPARLRRTPLPLLFCAPDKPALEQEISALLKTLNSDAHGDLETLCAPYRLGSQTQVQGPRLGLLACDTIELQQKLQQALNKLQSTAEEQPQTRWQQQGVEYRSAPLTEAKTAALFAGQGSQYLQMGSGLTQLYPELRAEFAAADREFSRQGVADKYGMGPLSARVFPIAKFTPQANKEDELALANTRFAQSAIGALGMGQFTLLCQAGFQADMLAGHSFGELSALRAAGALSRESYYALAFARGDAMASVPEDKDPGAMSAVILPSAAERNTLEQLLQTEPEVQIANINSPVQLVIAGASEAVTRLNLKLNEAGLRAIALPVSGAFHTPLVAHAQQPFAEAIAHQGLSDAKTPLYVNATGDKLAQDAESLRANLEQHMLKQVRFSEQIESMYRDGARIFVEFGPKNTLAKLAQATLGDRAAECLFLSLDSPSCIDSLAADTELKQAIISLALAGLPLTDPDAYRAVQTQAKHKASPMTIKLGASNYISPATARKMAASLKEGRVSQQTKIVEKVVEKIVEIPVAAASQNPSQPSPASAPQAANGLPANNGSGLQQFFSAQQQLAELHQQFLNIPLQYGNSVQQLLAEQVKLATAGKAIPDSLNQTLAMFHQHQAETLKIHNDFIQSQNLGAQQLLQQLQDGAVLPNIEQTQAVAVSVPVPVQAAAPLTHAAAPVKAASTPQQPSQVLQSRPQAPAPVPAVAVTTAKPSTGVEELMLQVVADKTGYPTEMLELGMDMEADLGIDSIKRVEILGTVQDQLPNLPQLDAATLSECRTLGQIVAYLQQSAGVNASVQPTPAQSNTAHANQNDVTALMLQVVADKTGYPAEMLELGMDMEADLGIDSIKRVEILGTVQDALPELPQLDAATLSECRTLGQIVDYLQQSAGVDSSVQPEAIQLSPAQSNTAHANQNDVTALMLQVVADKTGYPAEMLELGMDMEADLGIDSIKRVEILGTVQDQLPELPQLDAATLSECRTLGQIVDYLQQSAGVDSSVQPEPIQLSPAQSNTAHANQNDVTALMLQVVADKTGYPAEMLELGMDMEADLGIDSIKRVEILGTVQDQLPELPPLDAATLSECRTLGQIVDYLQQSAGVNASVQPEPIQPSPAQSNTAQSNTASDVTAIMLQVVADKTGYPAEMLELGMDMEADLGIDSIKRVEILGTVQDQLPELPQLDAASLSECRTLGQIIDCFAGSNAEHAAEPLTQTDEMPNTQPSVALPPHSGVSLKKLPAADRFSGASAEALFAANSGALLLDDGHNAGVLAKKLTDSGISVTLVRPAATDSQSALDSKLPILTLASNDDAGVKALIAGLKQQVAIYIHLQPQLPREQLGELMPLNITAKTQVQLSFLFAKHLSPAWQTPTKGRRAFITVARMDGQLGFSGQPCELNQSALFGLTKTLAQEWPQVHCRALDLAPELDASALASQVMDALYSPSKDPLEWGKSAAGRVTLVATSADDKNAADTSLAPCRLDSSDKILVTGGAKGVTLDCALALARESGSHFILAGRSKALALEAFPDWAQGLESGQLKAAAITALLAKGQKPSPKEVEALIKPLVNALEIHAALKRFEAIGASAEYLNLDVSNPDAVASTLAPIQALAPISGLIHGAGVLADKHIADKTLAELELVTGTKVGGLSALLSTLAPNKKAAKQLKLLALFSSAAGFYGNTGQSDYAMANEILNKTAHRLHHELPTTRVISFNWGPWDGGMVNAALKQMFESRGVYVIPREAGAKLFAEAILARSEPQLLIGSSMQGPGGKQGLNHIDVPEAQAGPQTLSRSIKRQELALLEDHCIGGNPVWPTVCALQWMLQSAQSLFGGDWRAVDYKLLKGVVFDTDEKRLQLSLTLGADGELQASISCDERPQYQATLLPLIQQPLMPQHASQPLAHVSMPEIGEGEPQVRQGSEFYHSGALFHGPQLQAITEVLQFDDQGLSCRYRLPEAASSEDRALIQQDALLQAMLIWARLKYDAASLPSSLAALWQNALLPENDTGLIRLQVTKHSSRQLSADLALFNAEGQLQTGLENAKVTISKGLNAAFEPAKVATGNRERP